MPFLCAVLSRTAHGVCLLLSHRGYFFMPRLLVRVWERYFGEPLRKVEAESLAYRLSDAGRRADLKTPAVLITAAACLVLQNYTDHPNQLAGVVGAVVNAVAGAASGAGVEATLLRWEQDQPTRLLWWALNAVFCYTVFPILLLKLVFRQRLADHGLKLRGLLNAWPLYVCFVTVMVPLVWTFSATEHFQRVYPFLKVNSAEEVRSHMWKWEPAYALQFVALEFFFRGFIVHGTKHRFGIYAVFVAMVPYVQIHFLKPMPEAVASIVAGVVLGFMSLITRSVWLGAALHIGIAWGMDFACLYRRGLLP